MKIKKTPLIIFFLIVIFILGIFTYKNFIKSSVYYSKCGKYSTKEIKIGEKKIKAIISDNECKLELGLSGSDRLLEDQGMLFIFNREGNYGFWMKDMNFSLDIIWISSDFYVVGLEKDVKPNSYPQIFGENYKAKYVLELPAGFSEKNSIKIGEKIFFSN